ncbi:Caspase domain protein [Brevundimonas sp. SH203]|uniref:caspase family protein n=1 Tax=Brevundimonas sp. SH203 TaxID=345167 RepID=UPI0009CB6D85|nr:caspase family protein [Brevundimonas sp. SH203]GAW40277.1 Caspase domain protein [Brevundimonas sp. SH203]
MARTRGPASLGLLLALGLWAGANAASAESRALLIGVGRYRDLPSEFRLAAPEQDVARLGRALKVAGLGEAGIETISDDDSPAGASRSAILERLATLEAQARADDRVLIYFSGHGGQRPAAPGSQEPDGLEEVWLASDATLNAQGQPDGGFIADHEIAAAVARLRARGVDVWLVVDACYAAGVTRGREAPGAQAKTVSRGGAGRRGSDSFETGEPGFGAVDSQQPGGRFVGFYAAGDGGLALATDRGSVFSNALIRSLDAGRTRSLRDLAAGLLSADGRLGPDAPRPVFEGDMDSPVLDLTPGRQRRFAVVRRGADITLAAGLEEGVVSGDRVVLEGEDQSVLGYGRVTSAGIGRSGLDAAPSGAVAARAVSSPDQSRSPAERVAAAIAALGGGWAPDGLSVGARLDRPSADRCGDAVDAAAPPPTAQKVSLFVLPGLRACDRLYIEMANTGRATLDVNLLYLSADGTVIGPSLHPTDTVRLAPGEKRSAALRIVAERNVVVERLAVLAVPAATRFPADLRYLAEMSSRPGARGEPGYEPASLSAWLADALDGRSRRGAALGPPPGQASMAVAFPIVVLP